MYNSDCPICYDDLDKKIHFPFKCGHKICLDCNEKLDDRHCPYCRAEIPIKLTKNEYVIFVLGLIFPPLLLYFLK